MTVKRILAILGCLILLMSMMTGCGHKNADSDPETEPQETVPAGPSEEEMKKLTDISREGAETVAADKLQAPGGKRMAAEDYLRGHPIL